MRSTASLVSLLARPGPHTLEHALHAAAHSIDGFQRATNKHGSVLRCLVRSDEVVQFDHYPEDDVVDEASGAHYFYHAHRSDHDEHGHLHLFWHADSLGRRVRHRSSSARSAWAPSHLIAIGLDATGLPVSLFTTNHWVTEGHWFDAERTLAMLSRFGLTERGRYGPANRFINGLLDMYRPLIGQLLVERDQKLKRLLARRPWSVVSRDIRHEVLSFRDIDWLADVQALEAAAARPPN